MEKDDIKYSDIDMSGSAFSKDGIDLTMIRWMLSLTPDERLQSLEDHALLIQDMRNATKSLPVSRDS
jgi:hypothetical protein